MQPDSGDRDADDRRWDNRRLNARGRLLCRSRCRDEGSLTATSALPATGSPVSLGAVTINTAYTINLSSLLNTRDANGVLSWRATATSNDAAV